MLVEKRWWTSASADSKSGCVQVAVIGAELVGEEHALVDQRPARHRDDVEVVLQAGILLVDARRNDLAHDVELALEIVVVGDAGAAADEHLAVIGLGDGDLGGVRQLAVVDRHVAPAEQHLALVGDALGDDLLHVVALGGVLRHEDVADRVLTRGGQGEAQPLGLAQRRTCAGSAPACRHRRPSWGRRRRRRDG